ncbi:MAG TPA: hypothetical protein VFZ91_02875, partial [Allosphingosinicella sp.]
MKTTSIRAQALACALLATTATCGLTAQPAQAQESETKLINFPAEKFVIAPGGVDLRTGRFVYSETDLSAGAAESGLALTRTMPERAANHANPFSNFSHNWDIFLLETRVDIYQARPVGLDYRMNVHFGGRSLTFESYQSSPGYEFKSDGPSASLTFAGGDKASDTVVYTLRAPDGTIMTFRPMGGADCADQGWGSGRRRCAFVSAMTAPDGTHYAFDYAGTVGGATGNLARLRRVTGSRGYALLLEGSGSLVTKACLLNLASAPAPANGLCPQDALATAGYAYEAGGRLAAATGAGGSVSGFTYAPAAGDQIAMGFVKPGQSAPWLTNSISMRLDEEDSLQEIV